MNKIISATLCFGVLLSMHEPVDLDAHQPGAVCERSMPEQYRIEVTDPDENDLFCLCVAPESIDSVPIFCKIQEIGKRFNPKCLGSLLLGEEKAFIEKDENYFFSDAVHNLLKETGFARLIYKKDIINGKCTIIVGGMSEELTRFDLDMGQIDVMEGPLEVLRHIESNLGLLPEGYYCPLLGTEQAFVQNFLRWTFSDNLIDLLEKKGCAELTLVKRHDAGEDDWMSLCEKYEKYKPILHTSSKLEEFLTPELVQRVFAGFRLFSERKMSEERIRKCLGSGVVTLVALTGKKSSFQITYRFTPFFSTLEQDCTVRVMLFLSDILLKAFGAASKYVDDVYAASHSKKQRTQSRKQNSKMAEMIFDSFGLNDDDKKEIVNSRGFALHGKLPLDIMEMRTKIRVQMGTCYGHIEGELHPLCCPPILKALFLRELHSIISTHGFFNFDLKV